MARASRTGCRAPIPTPTSPSAACWPQASTGSSAASCRPPLCSGNAALDESYTALPASLEEAVEIFEGSAFLRSAFGDRFVDHYALSRRTELDLWRAWLQSHVSAWEYERYFETI